MGTAGTPRGRAQLICRAEDGGSPPFGTHHNPQSLQASSPLPPYPNPNLLSPFSGAFCKAPTPPCSLLPSRLDPQALHHHRHHHHGHHHGPGHHPQVHHGLGGHHGTGFAPGHRGSNQHQAARPPEHPETQLHAARRPPPQAPRHQEAPAPLRLPPLPARGHLRGQRAGFHLQLPGGQRGGRLRET